MSLLSYILWEFKALVLQEVKLIIAAQCVQKHLDYLEARTSKLVKSWDYMLVRSYRDLDC